MMTITISVTALVILALLLAWAAHYKILRVFTQSELRHCLCDIDRVLALASVLHAKVRRAHDPYFVMRIFEPIGANPLCVLNNGGCCSGIHRLYITALHTIGIKSAQITLYHHSGHGQHCLVEAKINNTPMIIDVDYGVYYISNNGDPIGLEELQKGNLPEFMKIPGVSDFGYPNNDYYNFNYLLTKTANWTKSLPRRMTYRFLKFIFGDKINRLRLNPILEWPHVLLSIILVFSCFLVYLATWAIQ